MTQDMTAAVQRSEKCVPHSFLHEPTPPHTENYQSKNEALDGK